MVNIYNFQEKLELKTGFNLVKNEENTVFEEYNYFFISDNVYIKLTYHIW